MASGPDLRTNILLRSEQSGGHVSIMENVVAAQSAGPPLHRHDFDEAFYMLEGELIFQIEEELFTKRAGEFAFVPRNVPPRASQPQRRGRALCARLHARRARAPLRSERGRVAGRRATGLGVAADPRGHRGWPADSARWMTARQAMVTPRRPVTVGLRTEFAIVAHLDSATV